jgi:hypothetical protein
MILRRREKRHLDAYHDDSWTGGVPRVLRARQATAHEGGGGRGKFVFQKAKAVNEEVDSWRKVRELPS